MCAPRRNTLNNFCAGYVRVTQNDGKTMEYKLEQCKCPFRCLNFFTTKGIGKILDSFQWKAAFILRVPHGFLRKVGGGRFVKVVPQHSQPK